MVILLTFSVVSCPSFSEKSPGTFLRLSAKDFSRIALLGSAFDSIQGLLFLGGFPLLFLFPLACCFPVFVLSYFSSLVVPLLLVLYYEDLLTFCSFFFARAGGDDGSQRFSCALSLFHLQEKGDDCVMLSSLCFEFSNDSPLRCNLSYSSGMFRVDIAITF